MSTQVNVQEAKTRLSELLARVERGESVTIARAGKPVAQLTALESPPQRAFGIMQFTVPESFFEPHTDEELDAWE